MSKSARVRIHALHSNSSFVKFLLDIVGPDNAAPRDCPFAINFSANVTVSDVLNVLTNYIFTGTIPRRDCDR